MAGELPAGAHPAGPHIQSDWPKINATMAIRTKNKEETQASPEDSGPRFRTNPEIEQKIDAHIAANKSDFEHYRRLVTENPDRAIRTLILKDVTKHESDMKLVLKQMTGAKQFYDAQSPDVKERIDRNLSGVNPYYHDKAFVGEVLREMDRQNRRSLTLAPAGNGTAPKAAAGV